MTIILTTPASRPVKLRATHVEREELLQRYIHENPDSLPLDEISEDIRLCVICREFPTSSGPIDALGVDPSGQIYIIETKLFKNPDKRTVIAQALDYGSALWHAHEGSPSFIDRIDAVLRQRGLPSLRELLSDFAGTDSVETVIQGISENQASGVFRFVILMDKLSDRLKDLITFLNENSRFTVYAVELEFYRHEGIEIVLPRLYGAEVRKDVASGGAGVGRRRWDEQSFFADAAARLGPRELSAVRQMYEASLKWGEISWGTGTTAGSFSPKRYPEWPRAPFAVYSDGRLVVNFPYFSAGTMADKVGVFAETLKNGGFQLPADYGQRHVAFSPADWIGRVGALDAAVTECLSNA